MNGEGNHVGHTGRVYGKARLSNRALRHHATPRGPRMRSECLLQRFRPYLAPKSPSRPPEAQIEEELVVLNARPRWTVGSAIGKFTTQNPAVYHPQADKISISLPGPLPVRSSLAGTIQPFALPNIAGSVEGLQGAALRTRGGAGARLQAGARVCNVGSAWRAAVAGSSRWRRGCRPGWPAAPVRGARSHADSHLAAESATAGQSVRRIPAPTGHSARSPATSISVLSTAPRGPGTLRAQRHARGRPHHGPF